MKEKNVLILGGGIGGHVAANLLRRKLGKEHKITLVDRKTKYEFSPSFLWLMFGWREPEQITKDLDLLSRKGIDYVNGEVLKIYPADRAVKTSAGSFTYDYLIVALGAELVPETIPGFSESAGHAYTLEAAMRFKQALMDFSGGRVAVGFSSSPVKCPMAPYEAALLMDYHFRKRGIRNNVDFHFFTPEKLPMPVAGPEIGNMIKGMLESRNITYHPTLKLTSVDQAGKEITFENGETMKFDLLFAVPPHRVPQAVRDSNLTDGESYIPVDKQTMQTKFDDLYAIGDVALVKLFDGRALPKAGVFAHSQAEVVAHNIAADIGGGGKRKFDGKGSCFVEIGSGRAGFVFGDFYSEPRRIHILSPKISRIWHWVKILYEKYWLWRWF